MNNEPYRGSESIENAKPTTGRTASGKIEGHGGERPGYKLKIRYGSGQEEIYRPTHTPIRKPVGDMLMFAWETPDGESMFSLTLNARTMEAIELTAPKGEADPEVLEMVERAKRGAAR